MPATLPIPTQWNFAANVLAAADKVNAGSLDTVVTTLVSSFNDLLLDLGKIQRSDDKLMDGSVGVYTLDASVLAAIGSNNGWQLKASCDASTTGALPAYTVDATKQILTATANGALPSQDGITLIAGSALLVKDNPAAADNGIYLVTQVGDGSHPWILTRRSDAASSGALSYAFVWVRLGLLNKQTGWLVPIVSSAITLGTTAIAWSIFGGSGGAGGGGSGASAATFSVKTYGAKGDGITDDTVAIQSTLDAAEAWLQSMPTDSHSASGKGVLVFFPAGTYLLSSFLNWKAQSIKGEGSTVTRIIGAPGFDILRASTANVGGQAARPRGYIGDIALVLDDTVDGRAITGQTTRTWHNLANTETGQVGACCVALDETDRTQNTQYFALYLWQFHDLICECRALTSQGQYGTAGIYSRRFVYGLTAEHVKIRRLVYGYWEDFTDTHLSTTTSANDENLWLNLHVELCAYGVRLVNNENCKFVKPHLYSCGTRAVWVTSLLDLSRQLSYRVTFDEMYCEHSAVEGLRIEGDQHVLIAPLVFMDGTCNTYFDCVNALIIEPNINVISGKVIFTAASKNNRVTGIVAHNFTDYQDLSGLNNFVQQRATSDQSGNFLQTTNQKRAWNIGEADHGAVQTGQAATTDYGSGRDIGMMDPADWYVSGIVGMQPVVADPASRFGHYAEYPSPGSWNFYRLGWQLNPLLIGGIVPACKVTIYVRMRAPDAGVSDTQQIKAMGDNTNFISSITPVLSTGWTTISFDADLSSFSGQNLWIVANIPSANQRIQIAWVGIRPAQRALLLEDSVKLGIAGPIITYGVGSPDGVLSALRGSIYVQTDAVDRKAMFFKRNGAANTATKWETPITAYRQESGANTPAMNGYLGEDTDINTSFAVNGQASGRVSCTYLLRTASKNRFGLYLDTIAEGGSDAGSNIRGQTYNDAGSSLGDVFRWERQAGGLFQWFRNQLINPGTVTTTQPALKLQATWNNAAVVFQGIDVEITDTASNLNSLLLRLLVGGDSKFFIDKGGRVYIKTPLSAPTDAQIPPGTCCMWLDESTNNISFRWRYTDGTTYKTASIAAV